LLRAYRLYSGFSSANVYFIPAVQRKTLRDFLYVGSLVIRIGGRTFDYFVLDV